MKRALALFCLTLVGCAGTPPKPAQVENPKALPIALDHDFAFRKTKQFFLNPVVTNAGRPIDASIAFEKAYHLYGAVTALDQRQRYGNYYAFFWRAPRHADVTVRFEYRQDRLHAFVQAREVRYPNAHGSEKTQFAIIGDDFYDDGRVIAWRASLIVDGRIVALKRSYLWE